MLPESFVNAHVFNDIVEKYNIVCHVVQEMSNIIKVLEKKIEEIEIKQKIPKKKTFLKKCRYFNAGYCREAENCPFNHPEAICGDYLGSGQCPSLRTCPYQHPKVCKFWSKTTCYRGEDCCYLHQQVEQHESVTSNDKASTSENNLDGNIEDVDKVDQEALTVDHYFKLYEADADGIAKLIAEETDVEQIEHEEVSIEDIMKFYENKTEDELLGPFEEISKSLNDKDVNEKVQVNLQRSTKKRSKKIC